MSRKPKPVETKRSDAAQRKESRSRNRAVRPIAVEPQPDPAAVARLAPSAREAMEDWPDEQSPVAPFFVDGMATLDGFGVLLKGTAQNHQKPAKALTLRLDDQLLPADLSSLSLSGAEGGRVRFSCLFPSDGPVRAARDRRLKLECEDGEVSYCRLADVAGERVVPDDGGGPIRSFYAHVEREAFFGDYARAYYQTCAEAYARCVLDTHAAAPAQLVFAAPRQRSAQFLLFNQIRHFLKKAPGGGVGVTIVAAEAERHGEMRELFFSLREAVAAPCSLAIVQDPRAAVWALEALLPALGADRFSFVGGDVVLSDRGWAALSASLNSVAGLALIQTSDPCEPWREPERAMHAFTWTVAEFIAWRRGTRLPVGFAPGLGALENEAVVLPNCGAIDRSVSPVSILSQINRHAGVTF